MWRLLAGRKEDEPETGFHRSDRCPGGRGAQLAVPEISLRPRADLPGAPGGGGGADAVGSSHIRWAQLSRGSESDRRRHRDHRALPVRAPSHLRRHPALHVGRGRRSRNEPERAHGDRGHGGPRRPRRRRGGADLRGLPGVRGVCPAYQARHPVRARTRRAGPSRRGRRDGRSGAGESGTRRRRRPRHTPASGGGGRPEHGPSC